MAIKESKSLSFGSKGTSGLAICIGVLLPFISSQQIPTQLIFPLTSLSVNGSSATGNCTGATRAFDRYQCDDPTSSVVYDGDIPTLTGLDGNMWASQLLTLNASSAVLVFNFTGTPNFQVRRAEMVVFNCPQWGISVQSVTLQSVNLTNFTLTQLGAVNPTLSSCDSLLRVCISNLNIGSSQTVLRLEFTKLEPTDWIHIAEVGFYDTNSTCPPEIFIPEPTTVTAENDDVTSMMSTSLAIGSSTSSPRNDNTTTPTSTTVSMAGGNSSNNAWGVASGVIIALLIVIISVLVIVIVFVIRTQGKTTKFQSSIEYESSIKTLDKTGTIEDIEMEKKTCNHHPHKEVAMSAGSVSNSYDGVQHVANCEGEGGPICEDTVAKPTAVAEMTYEAVDLIPSQNGIVTSSKPQVDNGQVLYYQLVEKSDVEMYSTVKTPEQPAICAIVNEPKQRKPPAQPNPPPADEYATVNKHYSPSVPVKSDDLLTELSQQEAENEANSLSSLVASTSKSNECLGEKPLHCNTENLFPPHGTVCTETGTPLPNESGSIYEQIYEVKALAPSAFIKESYPEESHEGLYPCSSIYTVPEVSIEEESLELSSHNVQVVKELGSGNFGDVILAKTVGLSCKDLKMSSSTDTNVQVLVAVKMLKHNANMMDKTLFEKEYNFMARLNHPNVIRLLGVCKTSTPFIMMEYMENGDLNQYLKAFESVIYSDSPEGNSKENKTITTTTLISLCTQIASAMKYLASKNFVHRDLATRNCLVGSNYQVKIADFGMSRNMYESHYYVIKGHAILPIRWMATECFYGQFSAKTDVWAFGVTMWEIFELARNEPYHEMKDKDLVKDAIKEKNRKLLPCPKACPEEVYRIMNLCWAHKSSDRETFENLYQALSSL